MPIEINKNRKKSGETEFIARVRVRKTKLNFRRFATERFTRESYARKWASKKETAFLEEYDDLLLGLPPKPKKQDITLKEYIQALLDYMPKIPEEDQFSKGAISCLKKWQKTDFAKLKSQEINDQHLINHLEERIFVDGIVPATNHSDLAELTRAIKWQKRIKTPFNFSITEELKKELWEMKLTGKSRHNNHRSSTDEILSLYEHLLKRDIHHLSTINYRHLLLFSIYSTFRISEICRLKWSLYNPDSGEIIVEDRKDPKNKWGNHEKIPLNKECQSLLAKRKKEPDEDRIFPYKSSSVSSKFSEITQSLGMKKVTFHSCRHEGISRLFEQGHTIPQVAVLSGHKSWENLKRYTHLMQRKTPDLYKMCMEIEGKFAQNILNK